MTIAKRSDAGAAAAATASGVANFDASHHSPHADSTAAGSYDAVRERICDNSSRRY